MKYFAPLLSFLFTLPVLASSDSWQNGSPREEIAPQFSLSAHGGYDDKETLIIEGDDRAGLYGYWFRSYPVTGGSYIHISAMRRTTGMDLPRRGAYVRLLWDIGDGKLSARPTRRTVKQDAPMITRYFPNGPQEGELFFTESELPRDGRTENGWTEISGTYRVPMGATQVIVELSYQWETSAKVEWSAVSLTSCEAPPPRMVRIATANGEPQGGANPLANCHIAEPFVVEAAQAKADLIVFSEHYVTQRLSPAYSKQAAIDSAENIPGGPISEYFSNLARKNNIYIVVGMYERDGNQVFNDAVLFGPEGFVGKYRKATLTAGEVAMGLSAGKDYPVFETRFGRVGMMICYDTQFPEVARELCKRGAEIIAIPAYGFTSELGIVRAIENQVHLVSSVYLDDGHSPINDRWGFSGIISPEGKILARAPKENSIAIAEVDLNYAWHWPWLGNWKEAIPRHRPRADAQP